MKPVAFDYVRPRDLDSALAALREGGETCRVLAGGQSLGPMLNLRLARPALVVDINRIGELRGVERRGDAWHVGATTTHAMLEDGAGGIGGMLRSVARGIAYRAVRNRGTVGGSLAHADPAGDWPLALAALGALATLRRGRETREVECASLASGAFSTCLASDEILVSVRIPEGSLQARWGYAKACRKAGELAEAAAAVVIDPAQRHSRVVLGALGRPARILEEATTLLAPAAARDLSRLQSAVAAAAPELDAIEVRMQAGTLARALRQALS
ncbi:MAG TPA: FAD binding domain-containing protein [Usitatibacter sp.]|nr:FAD binding domain-containing protein [Usitatibacter sp.]